MSFLGFGHSSTPAMPKVPAPPQVPQVPTGDDAMRQAKLRNGFEKTILSPDFQPNTQKKQLLG